ncbi:hypothetical protein [Paracoccus sanguinis]|uniref:hypothetical protein n=1 Tax=Paracoccus sanguinis TaxID=1545044 RepID=UPI00051FEB29|nr:hypothetical protein [Paracoccus sanguinis]KGJ21499.1 hypothetical protein IX55_01950 [Paracoccus sanguinis]
MSGPVMHPTWLTERLAEARCVTADVAHHSDHLIRIACHVLARHGETGAEREDARLLLLILDAQHPNRARRNNDDDHDTGEVQP